MVKDRGHKENRDEASRPRTEGGDLAQRARSFFERATERAREAAREIGQRVRGDYRERERMGRDPRYGQEEYSSRDRVYGLRDEYETRVSEMYGGRESGRDWMRDERNRDYVRDEDRGFRASLGGDYRVTSDRGTVRDRTGDRGNDREGRDRDENRSERDDRSRDRRW